MIRRKDVHASYPEVPEALTILEGYLLAQQSHFSQIMVEPDCKQLISYLNGNVEYCSWKLYPILSHIRQLGCRFINCVWSWVPRTGNEAANFVARFRGAEKSDSTWVDRPPSSLVRILNKDGLHCPS